MNTNPVSVLTQTVDLSALRRILFTRIISVVIGAGVCLFAPAGTFNYIEAWIWIAMWLIPASFVVRRFYKTDPEFLASRMKLKEKEKDQRHIQQYGALISIICFLIPGFDKRYGWSTVPWELILASDIIVCLAYIFVVRVFMENRYASRVVEVQKDQRVISTGPYSIIRHPMYAGALLMFLFSPVALGSYWALIPVIFYLAVILKRIIGEEKLLLKDLAGYEEYTHRVKYRLIPGVW